jgi:hypothetical protein
MEVRDGFIVGIFNYCDRWCEACAFTSRCRLFADVAKAEAALDPSLREIVETRLLPEDLPPPPPKWMGELIQEMNEAASESIVGEESKRLRPAPPPEHQAIEERARRYCGHVHAWLRELFSVSDPSDPRAVIAWFHTLIPAKVHRALRGLADDEPEERDWPPDHDGSAKVALLGIDRSHAAWLDLVECNLASHSEIAPFIAHLVWLGEALERVFPNARAFVRPALDEPDAMLSAQEDGR